MTTQTEGIKMQNKLKKTTNKVALFVGALALISGSVAMAGPVTLTNTFTAGAAATAASVNQNFTDVKVAVDGNATDIGVNQTTIGTNATDIGTNSTAIGTNATDIGTNQTAIGTNQANIGTNQTDIGTNQTDIGTNQTNIGSNVNAIAANANAITALGAGGGTGGDQFATAVSIDCTNLGGQTSADLQSSINTAAPHGQLVITINGTCTNDATTPSINISRDNVTLLGAAGQGTTPGAIQGISSNPTVISDSSDALQINGLSIVGGQFAVMLKGSRGIIIENSTIGSKNLVTTSLSTQAIAAVFVNSSAIIRGVAGSTTFQGGIAAGDSSGIAVLAGSIVQIDSGVVSVLAGESTFPDNISDAIEVGLGSRFISGDLFLNPSVTITGPVNVAESSFFGLFSGSVTGDVTVEHGSSASLEADSQRTVSVTGTLFVRAASSVVVSSLGSLSMNNMDIGSASSVYVDGNSNINGNVTMSSLGRLFFDLLNATPSQRMISGTFTCLDGATSRAGTTGGVLANNYADGNGSVIGTVANGGSPVFLCGYQVP